ncbi:MAG TPA: YdeI/OmpD-associated family protein [Thermoanaerobaculia bacterium]|nr:YdeI/OmpD-associated family protein [Thermoanaerobaculia bacterium]
MMDPTFFPSSSALRTWLAANHSQVQELWIGFFKKGSGQEGITYPEALDEALCFGWIDGIRKRLDGARWTTRFTPRKPGSVWSQVNLKRAAELTRLGRMQPSGRREYEERDPKKTQRYSYEERPRQLDEAYEARFRENPQAWKFFAAQPPSYRRNASGWVLSAKKEETRLRRLGELIESSERGERLGPVTGGAKGERR